MTVIFDLAGTIFGSLDRSLRPGIKETIDALLNNGYSVYYWTGGPVEEYSICLEKAGIHGKVLTKGPSLPFKPDICVDDDPQGWMPGRTLKVAAHLSDIMPGEPISAIEIIKLSSKLDDYGFSSDAKFRIKDLSA